jgi:hypothetical protein
MWDNGNFGIIVTGINGAGSPRFRKINPGQRLRGTTGACIMLEKGEKQLL